MAGGEKRETSYYEVALTNRQVVGAFVILLIGLLVSFLAGVWVGRGEEAATGLRLAEASGTAGRPTETIDVSPRGAPAAGAQTTGAQALDEVEKLDFFSAEERAAAATDPAPQPTPQVLPPETTSPPPPTAEPTTVAAAPPQDPSQPTPRAVPAGEGPEGVPKWRHRGQVAREAQELESEFADEEAELVAAQNTRDGATPDAPAPPKPAPKPEPKSVPPSRLVENPPPVARGVFVIQVFSSSDAAKARGILDSLKDAGYPAMLLRNDQVTPAMYRVRVGPYRDRPAAAKVAEELRTRLKVDTWITSE